MRQDLVPQEKILEGDAVTIRYAHGDTLLYPLAEIDMEVDGVLVNVEAAVSETLSVPVLLGTDVPELTRLLGGGAREESTKDVMVVVTRAQARLQREEEVARQEREKASGVQPKPLTMEPEESGGETNPGSEFANEVFVAVQEKVRLTRREKWKHRQQY